MIVEMDDSGIGLGNTEVSGEMDGSAAGFGSTEDGTSGDDENEGVCVVGIVDGSECLFVLCVGLSGQELFSGEDGQNRGGSM